MKNVNKMPHFSYEITSRLHRDGRCIKADSEIIHYIDDLNEFYSALGYTDEMQKAGIEPEVFRWQEYSKDSAVESPFCLQSRIAVYLNKHSSTFREKYGREYDRWAGSCPPDIFREDKQCDECRMNPVKSS
jgi:hypothetical protein